MWGSGRVTVPTTTAGAVTADVLGRCGSPITTAPVVTTGVIGVLVVAR